MRPWHLACLCCAFILLAACGGSSGNDDTPTAPPSPAASPEPTPEPTPSEFTYDEVIDASIVDLGAYWTDTMPVIYGIPYEELAAIGPYFVSTGDVPECGEPVDDPSIFSGNAFYCSIGDFIAWDEEQLFPQLYDDYGDFAVALVLAHEWGHAIQARAGTGGPTILRELQADCFAGAWTANIDAGFSNNIVLSPGDLDEAIAGYLQFRDTPGTSIDDDGAHGSAFDRVNAFAEGYESGPERCAAYPDEPPLVVPLEFRTQEEFDSGGDLPYDEIAPLMLADLEAYWTAVMPDAYGLEWDPLDAAGPYYPSEPESLPDCGTTNATAQEYEYNAFYCSADDYIAWDDEGLMPDLYDAFGDFAVALVLGHEWGHAVQERAGIAGPTRFDLEQQADCFAGAWVAWIILENSPNLTLSPGDLDEAIAGFLAAGEAPDADADPRESKGTAFERVDAFQDGVVDGVAACISYAG